MNCKNDGTKTVLYEGSVDIFGPGTYLLICPTCFEVTEGGELCGADREARTLTPSERKLVKHGIRMQEYRASLGPPPKQYCACPMCLTVLRVEKKPCTAVGTDYIAGDELVVYIYKKAGQDVCKCFECKTEFYVFNDMLIHE
ncbi:MAG: hypothetical protein UV60_C0006G0008 [Parcubacteria group bacterium GW2011_GWA2_43_11]|nr:MAG: hypothetical protein UU89_C0005G0038 [Parcubacteria group bacterium GW2011_GWC2_42_11]KKS85656.1 MAG: hypothetical protein UV60_C0006G0008 [Parcubacteria group bacterium GW2011_GWA2_43_11]